MDRLLYSAYQANKALAKPARIGSAATVRLIKAAPDAVRTSRVARHLVAAGGMIADTRLTHTRPAFVLADAVDDVNAHEEVVVDSTPFGSLVHFRKPADIAQPKVLLVAPLSGHFATMLAPTVHTLLQDHDVYITDWHNARDVSTEYGVFGLDEYVDHVIRFLRAVGPGSHLFAVCQPCVPAMMATSILAQDDDPVQPLTLTLMSGPIDTRANPTKINRMACARSLGWYRRTLTTVPRRYPGAGRLVYPGFLQVGGFMSMNLRRHLSAHRDIYRSHARGEPESSRRTQDFYAEYFAVLDIAAEFYLDTLERVFQKDLLAKGEMTCHGRAVTPGSITRTALLTIEAERDDMCAVGQTEAAHGLVTGIGADMRQHYVQEGVGHYGVFAGSRWSGEVYPVVRDFIREHGGDVQDETPA